MRRTARTKKSSYPSTKPFVPASSSVPKRVDRKLHRDYQQQHRRQFRLAGIRPETAGDRHPRPDRRRKAETGSHGKVRKQLLPGRRPEDKRHRNRQYTSADIALRRRRHPGPKKQTVVEKLKKYFEKYRGLFSPEELLMEDEKKTPYPAPSRDESLSMAAEEGAEYGREGEKGEKE